MKLKLEFQYFEGCPNHFKMQNNISNAIKGLEDKIELRKVLVEDEATGKAVRVTPTGDAMLANKQTVFFKEYREKGIPASKVPAEVVDPLINKVMAAPEQMLVKISDVFDYKLEPHKDSFNGFVCEECGEMTVEEYGRIKDGRHVCIDCAAK